MGQGIATSYAQLAVDVLDVGAVARATNLKGRSASPGSPDVPDPSPVASGHGLGGIYGWLRTEQSGAVASSVDLPSPTTPTVGNQDLHEGDVFWCTADPGWVTGMSYGIIAPLLHGVTSIIDEADFDAERWYRTLEDQRVTVWYTAPTAIRRLMRLPSEPRTQYDLSALRLIHTFFGWRNSCKPSGPPSRP